MENIKSYKGQTEGLIYFVLLSGSRHTDEIKELIDKHFTTVKLGTLYAQISKMTANKTIQEFRASSSDGSRRKYYKITPLGLKTYNKKYANLFEGVEQLEPSNYDFENTAFKNIASKRSKKKVDEVSELDSYTALTHDVDKEIDFSMFENDFGVNASEQNGFKTHENLDTAQVFKTPENAVTNSNFDGLEEEFEETDASYVHSAQTATNNQPIQPSTPMFSRSEIEETAIENAKNAQKGVDYDGFLNLQYEYNDVLNKIFPKQKKLVEESEIVEPTQDSNDEQLKPNNDWSDIYAVSQKNGLVIRTSSDTNRYRGNRISINKLLFFTCLTVLGVATFEFLLFNLIFSGKIEYSSNSLITILALFGTAVLVSLIALILNPTYSKKDLPRFINSFEIALILAISSIIIIFALSAIKGVDLYNLNETFYNLILPSTMALNAPIFVLITYGYAKLEFFQTL